MRPARHVHLLNKAVDAACAAIEVYNKPHFSYREEAFSILILNAWELLLKARVLKEHDNSLRSIEVWEGEKKKDGTRSDKRHVPKKNRSGNNMTIGWHAAADEVRQYPKNGIDEAVIGNLHLLVEIRDNAIHLVNKGRGLQKKVQEIGTAALRNFAGAASSWFGKDLSSHNFAMMPLAFDSPEGLLKAALPEQEKGAAGRLLKLIAEKQAAMPFDPDKPFNVAVHIEMKFVRTASPEAIRVKTGPSTPDAVPVYVTEEQVLAAYPWDYDKLTGALRERYSNFLQNDGYHGVRRHLEAGDKFCHVRYLDPKQKKGKKIYYKPSIVSEFDKHYRVKVEPPRPPPMQMPLPELQRPRPPIWDISEIAEKET